MKLHHLRLARVRNVTRDLLIRENTCKRIVREQRNPNFMTSDSFRERCKMTLERKKNFYAKLQRSWETLLVTGTFMCLAEKFFARMRERMTMRSRLVTVHR